jgi:hypothetical protein
VHDTNEGDDTSFRFYVWQLGYALFPWTGLAPLGLLWWLRRSDRKNGETGDASVMLVMWFLFAFALFSFMGTKFHHYIFPAVPPVAMLVGVVLHDMMGEGAITRKGSFFPYAAGMFGGATLLVLGVTRFFPGSVFGGVGPKGELADPSRGLGGFLVFAGLALFVAFALLFRSRAKTPEDPAGDTHDSTLLAGGALAGALALLLVGRDLAQKSEKPEPPGAIRLLHLFTYNYKRPWPESLDFDGILAGFAIVAVLLSLALAVRSIRRHVVVAFVALGLVWTLWGIDVYLVKTSPHWGQHEVIEAYYRNRQSPSEQLVAYQMNWKGENFYSGNRIPAFVSTGSTFTTWLKKEKDGGAKVMFFVTEHSRVGGLKSEVQGKTYTELTTKELDNKFVLVKVEL